MRYKNFIFENYSFDHKTLSLTLRYSFDGTREFTETIQFYSAEKNIDLTVLDKVCEYIFLVAGTSYYKLFPSVSLDLGEITLTSEQAQLLTKLYQGGLSQYAYENELDPTILPIFTSTSQTATPTAYDCNGTLLMQSGGKDSLLSAELLLSAGHEYTMFHVSTTGKFPAFLEEITQPLVVAKRTIDIAALKQGLADGGLNGHIPFSALFAGFALLQAVLLNKNIAVASIETSAEEPNLMIGDFEVNHQYSKKYEIEQAIQRYIHTTISPDLNYGSVLRPFNEAKIGQLFSSFAWGKYRKKFSSCNLANYKQGEDDGQLTWCGSCPKCANSFLLFAAYVPEEELLEIFSGKNLLAASDMKETYRQLLGLSDIKPMECVGTIEEMRYLYHQALKRNSAYDLGFDVPAAKNFELDELEAHQALFDELLDYDSLR